MGLFFEWDSTKAESNIIKHKVSFEEASTIFADNSSITIDDPLHSITEKRFITIGVSVNNRVLVVIHTARAKKIRIISARKASNKEKQQYEK